METAKQWIRQITDLGLLVLALLILAQIVFGTAWPATINVIGNLIGVIKQVGDAGLAGLIAIALVIWLFSNRSPG